MNLNNEIPYKCISQEITKIGRITVIKDILSINGREFLYTYVKNPNSVCILPIYNDNIILINQYRHTLKEWVLELPCGVIEQEEDSLCAAKRELHEETGANAKELIFLGNYYQNQGISNARCDLYCAKCDYISDAHLDETEFIKTRIVPITEFSHMIETKEFVFTIGIVAWIRARQERII